MIRNKSNIYLVHRGINRRKNGKLLQQCPTLINRKNIRFILKSKSTQGKKKSESATEKLEMTV